MRLREALNNWFFFNLKLHQHPLLILLHQMFISKRRAKFFQEQIEQFLFTDSYRPFYLKWIEFERKPRVKMFFKVFIKTWNKQRFKEKKIFNLLSVDILAILCYSIGQAFVHRNYKVSYLIKILADRFYEYICIKSDYKYIFTEDKFEIIYLFVDKILTIGLKINLITFRNIVGFGLVFRVRSKIIERVLMFQSLVADAMPPMVTPPLDWKFSQDDNCYIGGYNSCKRLQKIPKLYFLRNTGIYIKQEFVTGLNWMQSVPYKLNWRYIERMLNQDSTFFTLIFNFNMESCLLTPFTRTIHELTMFDSTFFSLFIAICFRKYDFYFPRYLNLNWKLIFISNSLHLGLGELYRNMFIYRHSIFVDKNILASYMHLYAHGNWWNIKQCCLKNSVFFWLSESLRSYYKGVMLPFNISSSFWQVQGCLTYSKKMLRYTNIIGKNDRDIFTYFYQIFTKLVKVKFKFYFREINKVNLRHVRVYKQDWLDFLEILINYKSFWYDLFYRCDFYHQMTVRKKKFELAALARYVFAESEWSRFATDIFWEFQNCVWETFPERASLEKIFDLLSNVRRLFKLGTVFVTNYQQYEFLYKNPYDSRMFHVYLEEKFFKRRQKFQNITSEAAEYQDKLYTGYFVSFQDYINFLMSSIKLKILEKCAKAFIPIYIVGDFIFTILPYINKLKVFYMESLRELILDCEIINMLIYVNLRNLALTPESKSYIDLICVERSKLVLVNFVNKKRMNPFIIPNTYFRSKI